MSPRRRRQRVVATAVRPGPRSGRYEILPADIYTPHVRHYYYYCHCHFMEMNVEGRRGRGRPRKRRLDAIEDCWCVRK